MGLAAFPPGRPNEPIAVIQRQEQDGARQRMDLAHELAHLILAADSAVDSEDYAKRFARRVHSQNQPPFRKGTQALSLRSRLRAIKAKYGIDLQA